MLADVDLLQRITQASRAMVRNWVLERTGIDGRIGSNMLPSLLKWTGFYQDPITRALQVGRGLVPCVLMCESCEHLETTCAPSVCVIFSHTARLTMFLHSLSHTITK